MADKTLKYLGSKFEYYYDSLISELSRLKEISVMLKLI